MIYAYPTIRLYALHYPAANHPGRSAEYRPENGGGLNAVFDVYVRHSESAGMPDIMRDGFKRAKPLA